MAWNTLTYACGHTEDKQLYGPMSGRDAEVAAAARHPCPTCRVQVALQADAVCGLPALTGSEKQIAWASECRAKLLPTLQVEADRGHAMQVRIDAGDFGAQAPSAERIAVAVAEIATVQAKIAAIMACSKAAYWIDNRMTPARAMIAAWK